MKYKDLSPAEKINETIYEISDLLLFYLIVLIGWSACYGCSQGYISIQLAIVAQGVSYITLRLINDQGGFSARSRVNPNSGRLGIGGTVFTWVLGNGLMQIGLVIIPILFGHLLILHFRLRTLHLPPAYFLQSVLRVVYTKRCYKQNFADQFLDINEEYIEALDRNAVWLGRWVIVRGYAIVFCSVLYHIWDSVVGKIARSLRGY